MTFWNLALGNHKGNSVEKYHWFLNKTQDIVGKDHGSHGVFIQNAKTSQCAWESPPIDNTDVMRRVASIGGELIFTLDTELLPRLNLNPDKNQ